MTPAEIRTHLRYSTWASQRLLEAAKKLNPDDLTRNVGASHASILGTLSHIHFADRIWYSRVVDANEPVIRQSDLATLEKEWPAIQRKWEAWAENVQPADLTRLVPCKSPDGVAYEIAAEKAVLHLVNHDSLHRGQVMGMIRQLGIAPPPTDLMMYYRLSMAGAVA
ncbi:MAG TPA: DinB family protein [Bryobacteraceae bacterium]|nr:DinB family protein [Bryobacteraceae bacterium]